MTQETNLVRAIGRWDLIALAINGVVGTAIFGLPASIAGLTGPWSPLACLVSGAFVMLIVLCFAEAATLFEGTGGPYLYAREAFGNTLGLAGGWMMWLTRATAFAANSNLMVSFIAYFVPQCGQGLPRAALLVVITGTLTWTNYRGVRQGAMLGDALAIAKLLPIIAFVIIGSFFVRPDLLQRGFPVSHSAFSQAVLLYGYAYSGFEFAAIPSGEARSPKRDLPTAMITALLIAAALYGGVQFVCVGTLPGLAQSQTAVADASAQFMGPTGGMLIALAALVSISGNLSAITLVAPRLTFALANDGLLPSRLAAVHGRYRTPHVSILLFAAVTLALALSGSFVTMLKISAVARIIPYALTCLAVPVLRRKYPDIRERFRLSGGPAIPVLAVVLCVWLLTQSPARDLIAGGAALALGFLFYGITLLGIGSRRSAKTTAGNR